MRPTRPRRAKEDPLERKIENALELGDFITYSAGGDFISGLEEIAADIAKAIEREPVRAVRLYETFIAGCYEKAEELDDSSGNFGMIVEDLFSGWIKARQGADSDPDETAKWLLARMDDDPYGFTYLLARNAVKVMNKASLAAFANNARSQFTDAHTTAANDERFDADHARRRLGEVLRAVYIAQRNIAAYVALCKETQLSAQDCLAVATLLRGRKAAEALGWIERGLVLDQKQPHGAMAGHDLAKMKRELLMKLGRAGDALEEAWGEYREHPDKYSYEELMRFVPKAVRAEWHAKAMAATSGAELGSLIELWIETKEINRLVDRLRQAKAVELEEISHYVADPVARKLENTHPEIAATMYRALGMRILKAKKSKYYDAVLANFENARRCYERAKLGMQWKELVREIRSEHKRKTGFMPGFEDMVADSGPSERPTFLERAKRRWSTPRNS